MRFERGLALLSLALIATPALAEVPVIPRPQSVVATDGAAGVSLPAGTPIVVPAGDRAAAGVGAWLADSARQRLGLTFGSARGPQQGVAIRLVRQAAGCAALTGNPAEGYCLDIDTRGVTIAGRTRAGLLHGAVSLWQLLAAARGQALPALHMSDQPRYAWRGLMLDSARHMQSVGAIERLLDVMALHKLNRLQWHLTDDQGWRLPVRAYPRLTAIGGWRSEPDGARYGGFYTAAQIRHLVAYAAARAITIVPEIEMPGHALAALRAYPAWGYQGVPASAQADWGIFPSVLRTGRRTLHALETVLDETMALFPGHAIATGGDEVLYDQWHAAPAEQAQMKRLGLPGETALQAWFARRIAAYLARHGRQAIGWDDLLAAGGVPPGTTVLSWHGAKDTAKALAAGHDVVLATDPVFYFDHRQAADADEPPGRGTVIAARDIYAVEPGAADAATPGHLLGVQGEIWTEYVRDDAQMLAMAWPRAAALAELGWTARDRRDWAGFAARLPAEARLLDLWEVRPTPGAFGAAAQAATGPLRSQDLETCANRVALNLPVAGGHPVLVDIMDRCWLTPPLPLDGHAISVRMVALPFNYQLAGDAKTITLRPPKGAGDELVVRQDICDGPELARVPLGSATVPLAGAATGAHRLCLFAATRAPAPLWAIDTVTVP